MSATAQPVSRAKATEIRVVAVDQLAVRPERAAELLSMSDDFFRKHVLPDIAVVYVGRLRLVPINVLTTGWRKTRSVGSTRPTHDDRRGGSRAQLALPRCRARHTRDCPATGWNLDRCICSPTYRGTAWSRKDGRLLKSPPFASPTAAKNWAQDAKVDLRRGVRRAPAPMTVGQLAEAWLEQLDGGLVRTRSGGPYKPSTRMGYRQVVEDWIVPELGSIDSLSSTATRSRT